MFDRNSHGTERYWRAQAERLSRRLNFHHWLARVVPHLFVLLAAVGVLNLAGREAGWPARWIVTVFLIGLASVLAWSWTQARSHFCDWHQGMRRLETVLNLHNRLSAAQEGVGQWPAPAAEVDGGYTPNWKQILIPVLAGVAFLAASRLVPVGHSGSAASAQPISEPPEMAQVQSWIDALKAQQLIQPDKLQEMQAALDKLRERSAQDWYTQGNLEAASSLKEVMEQSMNSLSHDLDGADQAVQSLQQQGPAAAGADALRPVQDQLRAAGQNLAAGSLPLNHELVSQLKDAASDKPLTARQLAELHERLRKGALAAGTAAKAGGSFSKEMQDAMAAAAAMGAGGLSHRQVAATGGLGGGTATAPLELQQRDKTTPDGKLTAVRNDDMSRASLGQTVKISASAHQVDPAAYTGLEQAGAAQSGGNGGEAVWRSTYDPQEADTLDRFFK